MSETTGGTVPSSAADAAEGTWVEIPELRDLGDDRTRTVEMGGRAWAVSRCGGKVGVLANRCPHQGGPLGEGTIEDGWLRCPWHGYEYNPATGQPPPGFTDAVPCVATRASEAPGAADGAVEAFIPEIVEPARTVGDVLVETLVACGIDTVFGMVGHSNLGIADAFRRAEERGDLSFIGIRHEGAAAFAAVGYAKLTGRPAACFAIAGPGSTNLLTGLYDAKVDRAPVIAISGQVPSSVMGRGAFQDLDLMAAFADVAAWQATVHAGSDVAELTTLAVKHAIVERGVAHLVIPDEVQVLPRAGVAAGSLVGRVASFPSAPAPDAVAEAVERISAARRPLFVIGYGARDAAPAVLALAETVGAPVATTFKAKGAVSDRHPLAAGVIGRSGTPVASAMMNKADLLVVFGASFANHTGLATYVPTIQIDTDPLAIGRFHPIALGILGDAELTADTLRERVATGSPVDGHRGEVAQRWQRWRSDKATRVGDDHGRGVSSAAVFDALTRHAPADAVIAVDVGNHAYSFGRYFECDRHTVMMSGYLGSIGFGYAAAMGAAMATDRPVIAVTGDGGFGQYLAEVTTTVRFGLPVRHVLLDNGQLGKITKEQYAASYPAWKTGLTNPDFAEYARLCGATGLAVRTRAELEEAMATAMGPIDGPVMVHIHTDPELV